MLQKVTAKDFESLCEEIGKIVVQAWSLCILHTLDFAIQIQSEKALELHIAIEASGGLSASCDKMEVNGKLHPNRYAGVDAIMGMFAPILLEMGRKSLQEEIDAKEAKESAWRREEFERGYNTGFTGAGYRPTSRPYIEGFESGELAARRKKHRE